MFAPRVLLHPDERYFPMDPLVFISISRFRHHLGLREDYGYNKTLKQWLQTSEKTPDYYDIPVDFINSYRLNPNGKNRRPRDTNRGEKWNVFLEADGHPSGDRDPNGTVPTFLYERNEGNIRLHQYWFFFGYNSSRFLVLQFNHQGDWEDYTVVTQDAQVIGAWFSAHGDRTYYNREQLEMDSDQINVYCAKGSHALYPRAGSFDTLGTDITASAGYSWDTSLNVQPLSLQPWRDFAGAWGDVGELSNTTGPLGAWYKLI
ncbi:MAG: Vps62-related protein [Waterburya sp.]